MLISELTRHYNNNTNASKKAAGSGTKGVERLVSTVREMAKGSIFEGTVNSIKGQQVVLGLSNGSLLSARLDASMQLLQGQSMFFQVKSNDGNTISISPYMVDGEGANPTLLNALKAANLPAEGKYLNMVNTMMQEQMPIDKNSMTRMARILMANPDVNVQTLVQMKKLNIPITTEFIAQFENYMDDSSAIHTSIDRFMAELPSVLGDKHMSLEQMKSFGSRFLHLLAEGIEDGMQMQDAGQSFGTAEGDKATLKFLQGEALIRGHALENITISQEQSVNRAADGSKKQASAMQANAQALQNQAAAEEIANAVLGETMAAEENAPANQTTLPESMPVKQELLSLLKHTIGDCGIKADDSAAVLLQKLANQIAGGEHISKEMLTRLFSDKEMVGFLRDVMEEQFLLSPKEAAEAENIKKLYDRLETKMNRLDSLLQNVGIKDNAVAQTLNDVRGNIQFMNQINEAYTFVQIPLKMSNQNASGQLYVYTNKKDIADPERELTAFLHLDLEYLGSTDVSVRMLKKEVSTKFYMDTDESFALLEAHMPILEERLRKKGYNCKVEIINDGKHVNFVEDFLKKDAPSAGQLHRYSFDVRA
uniref:flagellar hook-length control protein FliK n=1 Tax=Agathobacter sp. TaxID=2021311 RepID=UPI004056DD35